MVELEVITEQLGVKKGNLVTQDTVDELNKLAKDPDYGEEFLDSYISHFNILEKNSKWSTPKYMNAMKFFTLMEGGHNAVDAYVKTFPDRLANRVKRGEGKKDMGGEASRFNASPLVNEIRKVAGIGVQLIHRNILHEAILKSADMLNDDTISAAVRQKAAETLIRELKPSEDATINVNVNDGAIDAIAELRKATEALAIAEHRNLQAGVSIKAIGESKIIEAELDE